MLVKAAPLDDSADLFGVSKKPTHIRLHHHRGHSHRWCPSRTPEDGECVVQAADQSGLFGSRAWTMITDATNSFMFGEYHTTWTALNVPKSQQNWAINSLDEPTWVSGDMNVYGRVYVGFTGSGTAYIDTADACPWVNFSNVNPNESITGTLTLTAQHSGLVPVSNVQFSVDGVNIGSPQTGQSSYSVSWNSGGVGAGAHTLKVQANGNCSGSFSIPITTH
jgi:hypothetical protein